MATGYAFDQITINYILTQTLTDDFYLHSVNVSSRTLLVKVTFL